MALTPYRLKASSYTKVWGAQDLAPLFPASDEKIGRASEDKIGEIWFTDEPPLPLLFKFLFTTEKLSVQVHPNDDYARVHENGSRGKTEMWRILRAGPGAKIAIGFQRPLTPHEAREAAVSGEIMEMLNWIRVHPGETYLIPAGVVHAIGGNIALAEIQQQSDVTYRLYDYGRDRELHLDKGMDVSYLGPHDARVHRAACRYFEVDEVCTEGTRHFSAPFTAMMLEGAGTWNGIRAKAGECWQVPEPATFECETPARMLLARVP